MTPTELADKIEHATTPPGGTWGDYVRLDYACWRMVIAALRSSEADELSRLRDENQRFRNGYANLMNALQNAPGLPLEGSSDEALVEWTNIITGILMALGTLDSTGKPISPWEALLAVADGSNAPLEKK